MLFDIINKKSFNDSIAELYVDGSVTENPAKIVTHLNDYFVNIGKKLSDKIEPGKTDFKEYLNGNFLNSMAFQLASPNEIVNIVNDFKSKSSSGIDGIPTTILKSCIHFIAFPLTHIVNSSLQTGCFPHSLKIAKIYPLYKSGDKIDISNYRPISILPSFSKIFEKIVFNRLITYLEHNNILNNAQYGFRKKLSTYMPLLNLYDQLSNAGDNGLFSIGIFIDLSKAFDTINHTILLAKLSHYGIRGTVHEWFSNYLKDRSQCVEINRVRSSYKCINCGVPQGSILGPLLFIIYINDIINCSALLYFILFADDTNLLYSCNDLNSLQITVNRELSKLSDWFASNRLSLNIKKTNYILFGNKRLPANIDININGITIDRVEHTKFLGVIIDDKLTWTPHINYIASKIAKGIGIINRIKRLVSRHLLLTLYNSLIYPYLLYCNIVWGGAGVTALRKILTLQKRCVRIITGAHYRASSSPLFIQLQVIKISEIHIFTVAQFMYKIKFCLLPQHLLHFAALSLDDHYNTRKKNQFVFVFARTNFRQRNIRFCGPKIWDALPVEIQNTCARALFKRNLLHYLLSLYVL